MRIEGVQTVGTLFLSPGRMPGDVNFTDICILFFLISSSSFDFALLTVDYVFDFLFESEDDVLIPDGEFSMDTVKAHRRILEHLKQGEGEQYQREMAIHLKEIDIYLKR